MNAKTQMRLIRTIACLTLIPGLLLAQDIPVNTESAGARAHLIKGLEALDANRNDDARAHFDKAIQHDPTFAAPHLFRTWVATSGADWREHAEAAVANRDKASPFVQNLIDQNQAGVENDAERTMQLARELVMHYPGSARAYTLMAFEYANHRNYGAEKASYKTAMALDPHFTPAYQGLATSYLFNEPKNFDKAEKYAKKYVKLAADEADAYILLGDVHRAKADFGSARDNYASAIEINPKHSTAHSKKGHADTYLGDYEAARADFAAAAEVASSIGSKVAQHNFGMYTHLYAGDVDAALARNAEIIESIEKMDTEESDITFPMMNALWHRGVISMHHGNSKEAAKAFKERAKWVDKAIAQVERPGWATGQKAGVVFWDAMTLAHAGDTKKARKLAEEHKAMLADQANERRYEGYHRLMGAIEMKDGNAAAAVEHLEQADQQNVMVKYELAQAHEMAGNTDGAMALYEEVANFNFNGLNTALCRNQAKAKLAM